MRTLGDQLGSIAVRHALKHVERGVCDWLPLPVL